MLKLFDAEDVLEHLIQLVLAEDQLRRRAGRHTLLCLAGIFIAAVDGVKLGHPGAEHRLLAQAVDLREAPHALLDMPLEDFPEIARGEAAALHHFGHAVALQEHLRRSAKQMLAVLDVIEKLELKPRPVNDCSSTGAGSLSDTQKHCITTPTGTIRSTDTR